MAQPAALEAQDVRVSYDGQTDALAGVSLQVQRGETVVLIGESGSGKSTLLKLFNAMSPAPLGQVYVDGQAVRDLRPEDLRRGLGYVQQEGGLLPHWTVQRNVQLVPWLLGWSGERQRQRSVELLQWVGLPSGEFGHRYPDALSGGQRQRVAFARALAADPPIILLDEPFGALDPLTRGDLQREFQRWNGELGKTTLLVTHDLEEAMRLGDRVAVMRSGEIHQVDTPAQLQQAPATDYVRSLLARGSR